MQSEVSVFSFFRRSTPEIDVEELDELLRAGGARVLDVREGWEYARGHIRGSLHIPLGQLGARVGKVPRNKRVLVICQSGNRSRTATDFLLAQGYEGTASVRGGTNAWARSRRKLER